MNDASDDRRDSKADAPVLITDEDEKAAREAANGLLQFDLGMKIVEAHVITPDRPFRLRPSMILQLHNAALNGLSAYAGNWRPGPVVISKSKHQPPDRILVPELVEDMCDYVNGHWDATAVHLAAYLMWRLNWIHPFDDGNGRTSRIVSYIVMCVRLGAKLPGTPTIPEQISKDRRPYFAAIEAADAAWLEERLDISEMERLLTGMLATQLLGVVRDASGDVATDLIGHVRNGAETEI